MNTNTTALTGVTAQQELPPLPEPDCYAAMRGGKSIIIPPSDFNKYGSAYKLFTAEQVRDYTRAALARQAGEGAAVAKCLNAALGGVVWFSKEPIPDETMLYTRPATAGEATGLLPGNCTCGDASALNVTHRQGAPCYTAEAPREPLLVALTDEAIKWGLRDANLVESAFDFNDGSTDEERDAAAIAAFRNGAHLSAPQPVLTPVGGGWQPIATAPKDGTEILAWREDCGPFMAKWTCVNELRTTSDRDRDELEEETLFSEDWFGGDSEGAFRADGGEVPSHWMPLPAAPGAAAQPASPPQADMLCQRLQQKCSDWKAYWRAPDAHGVSLSQQQALELLRDALGVEVEITGRELNCVCDATWEDCGNGFEMVAAPGAAAQPASAATTERSSKARFDKHMEGVEETPLERLRFFCSLAMSCQDWLDVEPFFDALDSQLSSLRESHDMLEWLEKFHYKRSHGSHMNPAAGSLEFFRTYPGNMGPAPTLRAAIRSAMAGKGDAK